MSDLREPLMICWAVSNSAALAIWVMSPVCSMKSGCAGQGVDLVDGELQGAGDVLVGGLVEADVAVADLDEAEGWMPRVACGGAAGGKELGCGDAAGHGPEQAGSGPGHAAEEAAAVDPVVGRGSVRKFGLNIEFGFCFACDSCEIPLLT